MANRGLMARIPIWVRVPVIIALVLVGLLVSPILLDAAGVASRSGDRGGGHGSGEDMEMDDGGHGSRDDRETDRGGHGSDNDRDTDGGGHGTGDDRERSDHGQGQGGPAAPSEPGPAAVAAQVVTFTIVEGRVVGRA